MKKVSLFTAFILLTIGLIGCQLKAENVEKTKVKIYQMANSSNTIVLEDKETIETVIDAINGANKEPGIVNMTNPEYKIEVGKETYFLWMEQNSGTIMNTKDTITIYSLTNHSIKQIYKLLSNSNIQ